VAAAPRPRRVSATCGRAIVLVLLACALAGSAHAVQARQSTLDPCTSTTRSPGWCGDGGPATEAGLAYPEGVAPTADGGFLVADTRNSVVRKVTAAGIIKRVAGIGAPGTFGDGGPATGAELLSPQCVSELPEGGFVIRVANGIRKVNRAGVISSVSSPEPCQPAMLPDGSRLEVDTDGNVVNRVFADGTTEIVAGTGDCGSTGDGGPATEAALARPRGVALLPDGGFLIADTENHEIREVSADGTIGTVAGGDPPILACGASGEYGQPIYLQLLVPLKCRARRSLTLRYETTYSVSSVITIRRSGRSVARFTTHDQPGRITRTLRTRLAAGRYQLELRASGMSVGPDEQQVPFVKSDRQPLVVTR